MNNIRLFFILLFTGLFFSLYFTKQVSAQSTQETCSSCQSQGKNILCTDTISRTSYCTDMVGEVLPNVYCRSCTGTTSVPTASPTPTPTPTPAQFCAQVLTPARNTATQVCQTFSTSCLPRGWVADPTCGTTTTPTPTPCTLIRGCPAPTPTAGGSPIPTPCTSIRGCAGSTPIPSQTSCSLHSQGDANCDNVIDLLDFNIWRDAFLAGSARGTVGQGPDFNNDGIIDLLDFNIWRTSFVK